MKYKAVLRGVDGLDRPKQVFGDDVPALEQWAVSILSGLKPEERARASVLITESIEREVKIVRAA